MNGIHFTPVQLAIFAVCWLGGFVVGFMDHVVRIGAWLLAIGIAAAVLGLGFDWRVFALCLFSGVVAHVIYPSGVEQ